MDQSGRGGGESQEFGRGAVRQQGVGAAPKRRRHRPLTRARIRTGYAVHAWIDAHECTGGHAPIDLTFGKSDLTDLRTRETPYCRSASAKTSFMVNLPTESVGEVTENGEAQGTTARVSRGRGRWRGCRRRLC